MEKKIKPKDQRKIFPLRFNDKKFPGVEKDLREISEKHRLDMTDIILSGTRQKVNELKSKKPLV